MASGSLQPWKARPLDLCKCSTSAFSSNVPPKYRVKSIWKMAFPLSSNNLSIVERACDDLCDKITKKLFFWEKGLPLLFSSAFCFSFDGCDLSTFAWGCLLEWCTTSPYVRESKTVLDSGFHSVDSGFQLLDSRSFSMELGFRISIVSGIPNSYSCIPDSKAKIPDSTGKNFQDSGFHMQTLPGFPYMGRTTAWCFCRRLQGFRGQGWKYATLFVLRSRFRPMCKANAFVPTRPFPLHWKMAIDVQD